MFFFTPLLEYIYTEVKMLAHIVTLGLPRWLSGKPAGYAGDMGLISGSGRLPGGENGNPPQ